MKLVAFTPTFNHPDPLQARQAGAQKMMERCLHHWVNSGHQATVLVENHQTPARLDRMEVLPATRHNLKKIRDADIFLNHLGGISHSRFARKNKVPVAVMLHSELDSLLAYEPKATDLLIFNSVHLKKTCNHNPEIPSVIVRPPIDPRYYEAGWTAPVTGRKYITLVNACPLKGSEIFIHLARLLPDYQFLAVEGGYARGDQLPDLFEDLPGNLTVVPMQPDLTEIFRQSRVVLCASEKESWGLAICEAAAAQCAVISVDLPGPREALAEGAWWISHHHRKILSHWLPALYALMRDDATWNQYRKRAYNAALRLFPTHDLECFVQALEDTIKKARR